MIFVNDEQDSMKSNFQDGVDTLYNACVSAGQTPIDKSPSSIANAIEEIKATGFLGQITLIKNGKFSQNNATITYNLGQHIQYKALFFATYYNSTVNFTDPVNVTANIQYSEGVRTATFTNIVSNSSFKIYAYGTGNNAGVIMGVK